jgi:hypothetical protein
MGCSRCLWLNYNRRFNWPVNLAMQSKLAALEEKTLPQGDFWQHFPEQDYSRKGDFLWAKQNVMSAPLPIKAPCPVFFGGEFDLVARDARPEKEGGLWIIDCKTTTKAMPEHLQDYAKSYSLQLMAYAWCLENPASDDFEAHYQREPKIVPALIRRITRKERFGGKVTRAGLKVFRFNEEPGSLTGGGSSYRLKLDSWYQDIELANYEAKLLEAAQKCVDIILQPGLPESAENCRNCKAAEEFIELCEEATPATKAELYSPLDLAEKVETRHSSEVKAAQKETVDLLRKHGGKTCEESKTEVQSPSA